MTHEQVTSNIDRMYEKIKEAAMRKIEAMRKRNKKRLIKPKELNNFEYHYANQRAIDPKEFQKDDLRIKTLAMVKLTKDIVKYKKKIEENVNKIREHIFERNDKKVWGENDEAKRMYREMVLGEEF